MYLIYIIGHGWLDWKRYSVALRELWISNLNYTITYEIFHYKYWNDYESIKYKLYSYILHLTLTLTNADILIQILMKVDETSSPNKTKIVISRAILRRKWVSVVVVVFWADSLVAKMITTDGSDALVWRCHDVWIEHHTTSTLLVYYNNILITKLLTGNILYYTLYSRRLETILFSYSVVNRNRWRNKIKYIIILHSDILLHSTYIIAYSK